MPVAVPDLLRRITYFLETRPIAAPTPATWGPASERTLAPAPTRIMKATICVRRRSQQIATGGSDGMW
ncbi:hypothetical protein PTRG_05864 [Pyrenophora tritici-repentis Pt-1C-BFP]|uniref:Uncharacterized protein n=1 Tax=Pyrenophora tritici-repentis (strain Pt-1C-BFP) TaxID=426418 RepID=B2W7S6_PYRTR|nr:uncharacterized protein PTRG_05864 [Pyrenophora tritici-repentis Pt-1C-BFP]EDU48784.1 hypothetical protein PTRG_05864 [Pyrenophora tritici-repentis Pt-1C-BFP]